MPDGPAIETSGLTKRFGERNVLLAWLALLLSLGAWRTRTMDA